MAEDCTDFHCSNQQGNVNQICKDEGWPEGHKVLVCDTTGYCCNCHCSCLEYGTPVAIAPDKWKAVEMIQVKEKVQAAGTDLKWTEAVVEFSGGTAGKSDSPFMISVKYEENGEVRELVVTQDNLFLMPDKKLMRADDLFPGRDNLVLADGSTAPVTEVKFVSVEAGVHHISTGVEKPKTLENHLLNVQNVVVADYVVQLFQNELPQYMSDPFKSLPKLGSKAYSELGGTYVSPSNKISSLKSFIKSGKQKKFSYWKNTLYSSSIEIPDGSSSFVSAKEAEEVSDFVPKHPFGDTSIIANVEYLFAIYKAFYPDVNFLLDWASEGGNAFATRLDGQNYVIMQGGLARCTPLELGGLAVIIAHELGHLYGGDPKGPDGYSCETQSDFYGVRIVMRKAWYDSLYSTMVFPGIDQITELFSYLTDSEVSVEGCINVTLDCRIETLLAGATSAYLPACAGGPAADSLTVIGADSTTAGEFNVHFNQPVDSETAEDIRHYAMKPFVKLESARVNDPNQAIVTIKAKVTSGNEYRVTVSNVIANNGEPIDPEKASADFEAS